MEQTKTKQLIQNAAISATLLCAQTAIAELIVLDDTGGTKILGSISRDALDQKILKSKTIQDSSSLSSIPELVSNYGEIKFPIETSKMKVGRVLRGEGDYLAKTYMERPLFIIGTDPVSMGWFKKNSDYLDKHESVGLIVSSASKEEYEALLSIAGSKTMITQANGDEIYEFMGIKHYPFYADQNGVMY